MNGWAVKNYEDNSYHLTSVGWERDSELYRCISPCSHLLSLPPSSKGLCMISDLGNCESFQISGKDSD